ncbi:lanthionine synthetase LanC family protein [Streptomyces sp. NPDC050617]|uniref:lanthionine synthetase LanC family protein n=1 Tax=Streptomyces sp. NPDC050617 TaxID=3154628 RepID=UPI00343F4226
MLARRSADGTGWPNIVSLDAELAAASGDRPDLARVRAGWCYGTAGVARSLQLAALALAEPEWNRQAVAAVAAACDPPGGDRGYDDATLCHGLAGLTTVAALMAREPGGEQLSGHLDELTTALIRAAGPEHPFLWPATAPVGPATVHRPGFLDGAAGVALALHFALNPSAPVGALPWDTALLLR